MCAKRTFKLVSNETTRASLAKPSARREFL
jgi:hypothetical protein